MLKKLNLLFFTVITGTLVLAQNGDDLRISGKFASIGKENIFKTKGYYNWGTSIIKGSDGKYHMFYSRWKKKYKFTGWLTHSEIAHATANSSSGPWEYKETVLKSRGKGHWDAITVHNPKIKYFEGKYYLYYISTNLGDKKYTEADLVKTTHVGNDHDNWAILRPNQRTGVAVSTSINGPWKRNDKPLIEPDGPITTLTVNPAIDQGEDGNYYLIVKGDKPNEKRFIRNQAVAISTSPSGPFVIEEKPVIDYLDTEDMSIWYDGTRARFYGVFHAHTFIGLVTSENGRDWVRASDYEIKAKEIQLNDGTLLKPDRMERPFIYHEKGVPKVLTVAVKKGDESYTVFLPIINKRKSGSIDQKGLVTQDWLIDNEDFIAEVKTEGKDIVLTNGLTYRKIRIEPNAATIEYKNLLTGESYLRSIKPEAEVSLNGKTYDVGGLHGLKEHGYLLEEWIDGLEADSASFRYFAHSIEDIKPKLKWNKGKRYQTASSEFPAGKELILQFQHSSEELKDIIVSVHYEIFDGIPLISKWIRVDNDTNEPIQIDTFKSEILAFPEVENFVETPKRWRRPNIHVESDYSFGGFTTDESETSIFWEEDPEYTSQVNWLMQTECLLTSTLKVGPDITLEPKSTFMSFRTYELLQDGSDRERNSLGVRKMYRLLAPWSTENPIFMHLTTTEPEAVKAAIDQCKTTGYEMVILSFGSGLNMEDTTAVNINKFKKLADYAHKQGIELGGYSLFSSRKISDSVDVIDKETGKPGGAKFGNAPCLASQWGYDYLKNIKYFLAKTGFDLLEHDGPYPGDYCASTIHEYHKGYEDSQWVQWNMTIDFYHWLKEKDIYLNAPDFYFLQGSNKCGIGYREVNWSLPRDQQIILGRQNIYDGTWQKTPSMAWTFVPLTEYHGGGAEATLEPLAEHLEAYESHMVQNYGSGVQACYRGPRLYDTEKTKELVIDQIEHYKKYRDILNADIVHLRRPDGRSWDGFMHVDPDLPEKAYVLLFNPTRNTIQERISIPLYYSGFKDTAVISEMDENSKKVKLNREYEASLEVNIPAKGYSWYAIR